MRALAAKLNKPVANIWPPFNFLCCFSLFMTEKCIQHTPPITPLLLILFCHYFAILEICQVLLEVIKTAVRWSFCHTLMWCGKLLSFCPFTELPWFPSHSRQSCNKDSRYSLAFSKVPWWTKMVCFHFNKGTASPEPVSACLFLLLFLCMSFSHFLLLGTRLISSPCCHICWKKQMRICSLLWTLSAVSSTGLPQAVLAMWVSLIKAAPHWPLGSSHYSSSTWIWKTNLTSENEVNEGSSELWNGIRTSNNPLSVRKPDAVQASPLMGIWT